MKATDVMDALDKHWDQAAIVPELNITDGVTMRVRRIDALMFQGKVRTAIEIKVDRADVKREVWAKYRPWYNVVHRFIYAVPAGLIERPPFQQAGLVWVHPDGRVEMKKRAKINQTPEPLPQLVVQNLAYRAVGKTTVGAGETE